MTDIPRKYLGRLRDFGTWQRDAAAQSDKPEVPVDYGGETKQLSLRSEDSDDLLGASNAFVISLLVLWCCPRVLTNHRKKGLSFWIVYGQRESCLQALFYFSYP